MANLNELKQKYDTADWKIIDCPRDDEPAQVYVIMEHANGGQIVVFLSSLMYGDFTRGFVPQRDQRRELGSMGMRKQACSGAAWVEYNFVPRESQRDPYAAQREREATLTPSVEVVTRNEAARLRNVAALCAEFDVSREERLRKHPLDVKRGSK